jgi:DNA-binding MarR family transcriptional regulator
MGSIDRVIHEPARLRILTVLAGVEWADFPSLCRMLRLTRGNLSAHTRQLERAGYIRVSKSIVGRAPHTRYRLTRKGRKALAEYWAALDEIHRLGKTRLPDDAPE